MDYYEACTDGSYPRFRDTLDFEHYYKLSRQAAWKLLDSSYDPVEQCRRQIGLLGTNILSLSSQDARLNRAFYAAIALISALGVDDPSSKMGGTFLSSDAPKSDVPLVFDTGCGYSISPCLDDFVTPLEPAPPGLGVSDFADRSCGVKGVGWVEWTIRDSLGRTSVIRTKAYYLPEATVCLFCPKEFQNEQDRDEEGIGHYYGTKDKLVFTDGKGQRLHFMLTESRRLPVMDLADDVPQVGLTSRMVYNLNVIKEDPEALRIFDDANYNLTKPQKELQLWHCRLGHAGHSWIQDLMRVRKGNVGDYGLEPVIPVKIDATTSCKPPKCSACIFARQHRRTPGTQTIKTKPEAEMAIRRDAMKPGDCVSGDQYQCSMPGRLPHTKGKESISERYNGGTLLVDHYSAFVFLRNQVSLSVGSTLKTKHDFEYFAKLHGVKIKKYRADNQPFDTKEFRADIELQEQDLDFSGVGAHFQNGVAERAVQTVVTWARAMMMHQLQHWPEAFDESLWPFALEHAVFLWNNMPRHRTGLSPIELFTGTKQLSGQTLAGARVWGCPAYVLDPKLQDGHKLPKWTQRSRCGVYLGSSSVHSPTVGRILNLSTGAISPQYHVVYDELFTTTFGALTETVMDGDLWTSLIELHGEANELEQSDRSNPAVVAPATDLYKQFRRDNDDEPDDDDNSVSEVDPVPEGGDAF